MNDTQWKAFCDFKKDFKAMILQWSSVVPNLAELQKKAALQAKTPEYPFENTVVYNNDLEKITKEDEIKLIVIGDNPGKDEQLNKNCRYLCGQAGKIAEGFFKRNPALGVDFRKNVIILNKTPVHSAKTAQLRTIMKDGGQKVADLILESQLWMAEHTALLHKQLVENADNGACIPELWLVGYSGLKGKGFFVPYRDMLQKTYLSGDGTGSGDGRTWEKVYVFQHFSMNRFTIDLDDFIKQNELQKKNLETQIHMLGAVHKKEIFISQ